MNGAFSADVPLVSSDVEPKAFALSLLSPEAKDVEALWLEHEGSFQEVEKVLRGGQPHDLVGRVVIEQSTYGVMRAAKNIPHAPSSHPGYLSTLQAVLHSALMPGRSLALVTRQWSLYKEVRGSLVAWPPPPDRTDMRTVEGVVCVWLVCCARVVGARLGPLSWR